MKILPNSLDNSVENVAVIMSTYNGERYIREQIESILNQKKFLYYCLLEMMDQNIIQEKS